MQAKTYLRYFLLCLITSWVVLDPLLFLVEKWDVKTLFGYLVSDAEVVFLGDSVLYSASACDTDRRSIPALTRELSGVALFEFTHPAFSPIVYRKALQWLTRYGGKKKAVVMPLNLRSFSDEWFSRPAYNFYRRQMLFDLLTLQPDPGDYFRVRFANFEKNLERQWAGKRLYDDVIRLGSITEISQRIARIRPVPCGESLEDQRENIGLRYAFHYGNAIRAGHPMFDYIQQSLEILARNNVASVLYLTPVNLDAIAALGGERLAERVGENLSLIRRMARERGWRLLDLSAALPNDRFSERHCACEHVDQEGRLFIARAVAERLGKLAVSERLGKPAGAP